VASPTSPASGADIVLPAAGKLGTPLFFDIGVFMVVLGVTLQIVFALAEAGEET
jgi:hypothetical protein